MRRQQIAFAILLLASSTHARSEAPFSLAGDSPRWDFEGKARAAEYQGRKCVFLDGGAAVVKDFDMRDAVVDVDVASSAPRGFIGIQFRVDADGKNGEWIYFRPHESGKPDALQYTPIWNTGLNWQLFNGPGFTASVDIPRDSWFHVRLEVTGAQAKFYLGDMTKPALVMDDLKSGVKTGQLALANLVGATYFSNFQVRPTADAAWERHLPAVPAGTLTKWRISPAFDALARDLEKPLSPAEMKAMAWQDVDIEPPGLVTVNRYRDSPHPRVTFQSDFSTRLDPQPGMQMIYATTRIESEKDRTKKLYLGYSDDVTVFLNGKILYRGRSAQSFRDPRFLGIVSPENDAVYLPLKKGANELVLAVSELGGGWGFIGRLADIGE